MRLWELRCDLSSKVRFIPGSNTCLLFTFTPSDKLNKAGSYNSSKSVYRSRSVHLLHLYSHHSYHNYQQSTSPYSGKNIQCPVPSLKLFRFFTCLDPDFHLLPRPLPTLRSHPTSPMTSPSIILPRSTRLIPLPTTDPDFPLRSCRISSNTLNTTISLPSPLSFALPS